MNKMMWKWKRPAAFLLAAAMIFTMPGVPASAVEAGASAVHTGLCEHHPEHTEDCGYTKGTEGSACEHEHKVNGGEADREDPLGDTEDCYTPVKKCIHEHDESCYPVLEGSVSENTATSSEVEEAQPTECTHECSEESGCITKELSCPHERGEHDESCGYIPATEGTPCGYTCEQCNSQDSGLVPGVSGNTPAECSCETHCKQGAINPDCPVCSAEDADLSACKGTEETVCICTDRCSEEMVNLDCPICSAENADFSACLGKEAAALAAFALPQADHTHCVCGGNGDVNGHEHDTAGTEWTKTDALPVSAGNYYLTQSVSGSWTVPKGKVNLCLNGQTINGKITIGSGATLTLTDCIGSGRVQGEVTVNGGKFELYSGTITGGVQVGIKGSAYQTGSSFTMYGGEITGNKAGSGSGGGVFLVGTTNQTDPPRFTMHGGTISDNTAGASDGGGGGVYVGEKCSFTMDGGAITGNKATAGNGGGIYIHFNAGTVSISNATITGNKASATGNTSYGHGGGIYSERGVTVENVTITGNNSTFEGGGIYGKGAITLTDATVTDNSQYDVYYDGRESNTPELTISGSVKAGYYANEAWKLPILVSGALREDSVIRVGVREGINLGAIAEPASGVTLSAENFKADAAGCVTSLGDDGKVYLVPCTHEMDDTGYTCKKCHTQFDARVGDSAYYQTLTKAFDAARGNTVTLLRDVTLAGNCSSSYTYSATLDLNGKTVSSERYYISVGGGNKPRTLTVKDSGTGGGTQALDVTFYVSSNGTLAVGDSYTGKISRVELQAGGALERFGGEIGELVLRDAAIGSTSTGYGLKLWNGNTNACTIGKFTDNMTSKSLTVKDLLGTDYAKCELHGEKGGTWSSVDKSTKIAELTGYTAYKVQFPECVHQCADDSNPVCSVCHKNLYTKITAKSTDGTTKTAYFTEDSALEHGYAEAIQTLNGWSNEGCTEPTLTLLRDMYAFGTSMPLTGTLTLEGGTHTAKNVTVAENANVTFASGSYRGATIDGTATVKEGVTFADDATVTVNGTLNAKGGTFTGNVKFNGSSIANISGGNFTNDKLHGGVEFFNSSVTGTISGGTFVFADFYTTKVKLSGGTFKEIRSYSDHKLADLLAEGAAYYRTVDDQAVTNDRVNTLENVKVVSHTHNGGTDGKGICSICNKQMTASLTVGGKTSWYAAFATAIEAANAADGAKTITLYQNVDDTVYGKRTAYELTRGPVTLATGGKRVDGVDLIAKGISLTVTGSNGSFYVTVDGKDAELTVNDKDTKLAIVTAKNGGKLLLSNGTFSRVAVMNDGSSASLSGGSYGGITSDTGYVKPYALLAKGYAYKKTKDNQWLPNANSIPSEVTVEKAPFAVEKIYPNSDTNYTGNSAFATDGSITLTAVIAPETEGVTYYYWWELFDESKNDWTTTFRNVNSATHTGGQSKTLTISGLPVDKSY
nr:right-handed parallel beta-helix repeat-containing protein [Clostridium sp. OF03-18AA]